MTKSILMILIFCFNIFALEIEIYPDKNVSQYTFNDVDALKRYLVKMFRFHIKEKGAEKIVRQNRALANLYLQKYGISDAERAYIRVMTEVYFADKLVEAFQKKHKIPEKVSYAYYLDNLKKFKECPKADLVVFTFQTPEDAIEFYMQNKDKSLSNIRLEKKPDALREKVCINKLNPLLKKYIERSKKTELLPPLLSESKSSVVYLQKFYNSEKYKPFEDVKKEIERELYRKTFAQKRKKILKKYGIQ